MIAARPAAGRHAFPSGWYGKTPAAGDFMARRLPGLFCDRWGAWLQSVLDGARKRLGSAWPDDYLSMPVWRFVFSADLLTPQAWAGVMAPSVDAVGRCFPLVLTSALPAQSLDVVGTLFAAAPWLDDLEGIALSAIGAGADVAALDAATAARPFHDAWLRSNVGGAGAGRAGKPIECLQLGQRNSAQWRAGWLAEASDIFGRTLLVCDELPGVDPFCAMMHGGWLQHGWTRCEPLAG